MSPPAVAGPMPTACSTPPARITWWSNRGAARANNVGWRIDYQFITPGLRDKLRSCSIYRDERFSDHAPFTVDYDL